MPGWLIDLFGSRQLNETFWALTLAPLPIWIGLVFFPQRTLTRTVAWPWVVMPLLALAYVVLLWKAWVVGLPHLPDSTAARSTRQFLFHPLVFLVLWAHIQMSNLFVGITLLQTARRRRLAIPGELALCWLFAPLAVVLFVVRVIVHHFLARPRRRR